MKKILMTAFALILFAAPLSAQAAVEEKIERPEITIMKFDAEWCASCRAMEPALKEFLEETAGKPVLFVPLNLTDKNTRQHSAYLAASLGFGDVFEKHGDRTGFALLLDKDGNEKGRFTRDMDAEAMMAALKKAKQGKE
ncbi:MAG: thioredoxin [Micavibrio sp.]|nr:MAG: thioredoxin [Micavibrio sp.]